MNDTLQPPARRAAAVLACVAALACGALAFVPGTAPAQGASSCGSRSVAVGHGAKQVNVSVSRITVEGGATCAEALKVIRGVVLHRAPKGWTVSKGNFKVPPGLTAQVAVNGRKKVKFALQGS